MWLRQKFAQRRLGDFGPRSDLDEGRGRRVEDRRTALICAVSDATGVYIPLWPVSLGEPQEMRAGDYITINDGIIAITPDLPGPHG